jgi:signal peptidase I
MSNSTIHPAPQSAGPDLRQTQGRPASWREYTESLLVTALLVLFATSFVVQAYKIPSKSMEDTLLVGDHLLVNKFVFGGRGAWYDKFLPYRDVRRGDIIVFKFPYDDHTHFVKRVIGLPGDRLKIVNQQVYVNGEPLEEPYKVHDPDSYDPYEDNFPPPASVIPLRNVRPEWRDSIQQYVEYGELVVPAGKYFVLGDNRDSSLDSRYWGFVDRENIMGLPVLIYWSLEVPGNDAGEGTFTGRIVTLAHTLIRLPRYTRWNRMFRLVR